MRAPNRPPAVHEYRLAGIEVEVADGAGIWWGDGERAYAIQKGAGILDAERLGRTVEGAQYVREQLRTKIAARLERTLPRVFPGARPVKVRLIVKRIHVSAALQRMFVGGGHVMMADVEIIDVKTGRLLSVYPELQVEASAGNGVIGATVESVFVKPAIDRVIENFVSCYANWLMNGWGMTGVRW